MKILWASIFMVMTTDLDLADLVWQDKVKAKMKKMEQVRKYAKIISVEISF